MKKTRANPSRVPKPHKFQDSILLLIVLVLDQVSKLYVSSHFSLGESRVLIPRLVDLTYSLNPGGAFGLWRDAPQILTAVSVVFSSILAVWLYKLWQTQASSRGLSLGVTLVLAGALGNLVDRFRLGFVIDFIDLKVWPIFNIADSGITLGVVIILGITFLERRKST